ncbi:MAG TPA: Ig-like domain-containing protein [Gemmatimonadaceae bacterium]
MPILPGKTHFSLAFKITAAVLSALTAAVTIFSFAHSYGLIGAAPPLALTVGDLGVSWVGLAPANDTLASLGDTIQLAATVTDNNGTALVGATIHWSNDNPGVVKLIGGGRVVAEGAGTATVIASVGETFGRSRITVRQKVALVRLNGDSALTLSEDERRQVPVHALDARGFVVPFGRPTTWRSLDTTVVSIDSAGVATGHAQGTTRITASIDGVTAEVPARVMARPKALEVVSGAEQRARAGGPLPLPIVVRLVSTRGLPVAGEAVRFRTSDGRGSADPAVVVTDEQGRAHTSWTLGELPGRQRLLATDEHLDSAAVIVAEAEPVAANTRVAALREGLRGPAGRLLADTLGVRVTDSLGRALADVPVSWSTDDGGSITGIETRTDSLGEAHATWTLGARSGVQQARVRVGSGRSVPPLGIDAVAAAGAPAKLALVSGRAQKGRVRAPLPDRLVFRVTDAAGNPVPGVTLALEASAGELSDSAPATDSAGVARVRWTMPREAGDWHLTARVPGMSREVEVPATALPAPPANVTFGVAPATGASGKPLDRSVSVTVTDVYGNSVPGAVVLFTARSGAVSPRKTAADAHGVARTRWTLGRTAGDQSLGASVVGISGARATLTVTAADPESTPAKRKTTTHRRHP